MHLHRSELRSPLSKVQGGYRSKARPFRLRSHWLWSLESVSLRPRFSPYDFGCVITLGRFSQITCALLALKHWLLSSTTIERGDHKGEFRDLQQKQGGIYAAEALEFCTYPPPESVRLPRSQTAPVCRCAGWPPASLAFLTVDMCITHFIFSTLTGSQSLFSPPV